MKTVNDYIAHNDKRTVVLIIGYGNNFIIERYYFGTLGRVPKKLRWREVLFSSCSVGYDVPALTIALNSDFSCIESFGGRD